MAEALQDAFIQQTYHPVHSTITLEVHQIDEQAYEKAKKDALPHPAPHVMKCVFCQHPVGQCTCDQWAKYRQ